MKTQQCPSRQELTDFDHGKLTANRGEEVSDHLEQCDDCSALLDSLEVAVDDVIGRLREKLPEEIIKEDSEIRRLVELAGSLQDTSVVARTETSDGCHADRQAALEESVARILAPPEAEDEIGRLGGYRVLEVLGSGGMGIVFKAEDRDLKRTVALKAMNTVVMRSSESARERFKREAQATAAVHHDNVVTIYQVGEDRDVPFLAMQLLEGESLGIRLRREGKLELPEALRTAREMAQGLAAAHSKGLTHRDIKPDNIWLEADTDRVKILDFGLAHASDDQPNLTQSGAIVGTPSYLEPEQAGKRGISPISRIACYLFFFGRPRDRNVDSRPSRLAARFCQISDPKGRPLVTDFLRASNSASVSTRLTSAVQLRGRINGQSGSGETHFCTADHSLDEEVNFGLFFVR